MNGAGPPLRDIPRCFEGVIPSPVCTCDAAGMPNVTYVSIVHAVDEHHVGISCQFLNKTRRNLQQNPLARILLVDPATLDQYRLDVRHLRTETDGALFDRVRVRLDAVAAQTGMSDRFRLQGVDVFTVLACEPVRAEARPPAAEATPLLAGLRALTGALARAPDLDAFVSQTLEGLDRELGFSHSMLLLVDEAAQRLYTVASHGYTPSGVGAEVAFGAGIIGTVAVRRQPVRITNYARDLAMTRAVQAGAAPHAPEGAREIPLPGLTDCQSELALPLVLGERLLGVLCLQSREPGWFGALEESAAASVAQQLAAFMGLSGQEAVQESEPLVVRHYRSDDSVFFGAEYLIKGTAGRILWRLLGTHDREGRRDFTNRELRLDPSLGLPPLKDNLEARLILLRRRLAEQGAFLSIVSTGRGRFRLELTRPVVLEELP